MEEKKTVDGRGNEIKIINAKWFEFQSKIRNVKVKVKVENKEEALSLFSKVRPVQIYRLYLNIK